MTHNAADFMGEVPLDKVPQIGHSMYDQVKSLLDKEKIDFGEEIFCKHVLQLSLSSIQTAIGAARGEKLYNNCKGICNETLNFEKIRKSISAEINYGIRWV